MTDEQARSHKSARPAGSESKQDASAALEHTDRALVSEQAKAHDDGREASDRRRIAAGKTQVLADLVVRFLSTCGTDATRKTYRSVFRDFAPFFDAPSLPQDPAARLRKAAEDYVVALRERLAAREEKEATVRRKMTAVSSFLTFCTDEGFLERNPLGRIKRPQAQANTGAERALTREERDVLLTEARAQRDAAPTIKARHKAERLELVVRLCLACGCRIGEVLSLRAHDITLLDDTKARVRFLAKGKKEHTVLIARALADDLRTLVAQVGTAETEPLFFPRLTPKSAEEALTGDLKDLASRARITKRVTLHTLRATCATLLHEAGVPLVRIQRLLGHQSVVTTSSYIRMDQELLVAEASLP